MSVLLSCSGSRRFLVRCHAVVRVGILGGLWYTAVQLDVHGDLVCYFSVLLCSCFVVFIFQKTFV